MATDIEAHKAVEKEGVTYFRCVECGGLVTHEHHAHVTPGGHLALRRPTPPLLKREKLPNYGGRAYVRFSGLAEWVSSTFDLPRRIKTAGMQIPPEGYAGLAVQRAIYLIVLAVPLGVVLVLLTSTLFPLLLFLLPVGFFLGTMYYPSVKASSRMELIESELAFFATYLSMTVGAGVPLYEALKRIGAEPNPLISSSNEMAELRTNAEYFSKDEELSAEQMSMQHPSKIFRGWLSGVLHVNRMGGDLVMHLDQAADKTLSDLEDAWNEYVGRASTIGTLTAIMFALIPVTVYIFILVTISATTVGIVLAYTFIMSPLGAVMLIILSEAGRPKTPTKYDVYYKMMMVSFTLATIIAGGIYFVSGSAIPMYELVGAALIMAFLPAALKFEIDWMFEGAVENNLPRLMDDLAENRRIGQDIDTSLLHVAFRHRYGRALDKIVDRIAFNVSQFTMGVGTVLNTVRVRSWHSTAIFFLLREATETGGGGVVVFDRLASFASKYVTLRKKITQSLRGYQALFYTISIAIITSTLFIVTFIVGPQTGLLGSAGTWGMPVTKELLHLVADLSLTGAVINSALLGLIAGKIGRGTIAGGSIHLVIGVAIALTTIATLSVLLPTLGGMMSLNPT